MPTPDRVAVLIDCDNISWQLSKEILGETAKHGTLSIKRGYGDWTSPRLNGWKAELPKHAIQPVQQFAYVNGKNATDTALIVDAMDLLYSGNVDVFCIVSSDSDFTRLAMRLRESGRRVFGIGERKSIEAFRNACDRFTFLEVLQGHSLVAPIGQPSAAGGSQAGAVAAHQVRHDSPLSDGQEAQPSLPRLEDLLLAAVNASAKEDGWAQLSTVGWYVVNNDPSFDSRNYGYPKLGPLVRDLAFLEVKEVPDAAGSTHLWVRRAIENRPPGRGKP